MAQDLRTIRTKKALKHSLVQLLKEKTFEELSVSLICENALVNRVTFYSHYHDKYELFLDITTDLAEEIISQTIALTKKQNGENNVTVYFQNLLSTILDQIWIHKSFIQNLGKQENSILVYIIQENAIKMITQQLNQLSSKFILRYPIQNISAFIVGGLSQLLYQTLLEDPAKQKEQLERIKKDGCKFIESLINNNIFSYS